MCGREFDLPARLAADGDTAVSRDTLMADVLDEHWHGSTKTLDVHIGILRRKLAEAAARHSATPDAAPTLTTLRGYGYRLGSPTRPDVTAPHTRNPQERPARA
jgi:DNA-binding response OmpR family regulator